MRFRPCIDIHNGKVKQIVGGTLTDQGDRAMTNYISGLGADQYARMYRRDGLRGGHVILLNPASSPYYPETKRQALAALRAYPGGLQLGGGVTAETAAEYLDAGASHVIVTSYVFRGGQIRWDHLEKLADAAGPGRVVLDLSCRKKPGEPGYYIVTDRWQTYTEVRLTAEVMDSLARYCGEFLVHGVDVEGRAAGPEEELVCLLASWEGRPVTYAGGIGSLAELERFARISGEKLDFTVGSALDLFGGTIPYAHLARRYSGRGEPA